MKRVPSKFMVDRQVPRWWLIDLRRVSHSFNESEKMNGVQQAIELLDTDIHSDRKTAMHDQR
jgi:hypothetical protein